MAVPRPLYFAWAAMTVVLWFMPLVLGNTVDAFSPNFATLTSLVTYIIVFIVLVRMTTLLPAAALPPSAPRGRRQWTTAAAASGCSLAPPPAPLARHSVDRLPWAGRRLADHHRAAVLRAWRSGATGAADHPARRWNAALRGVPAQPVMSNRIQQVLRRR